MNQPTPEIRRLSFYTSYRQFYLEDRDVAAHTGDPKFWNDEAFKRGLAVANGVLGIGTLSYGHIRCFFQVDRSEPTLPLDPWQHIVEASIHISKGRYAIRNCPDASVKLEASCPPGDYRVRVYGAFLDLPVEYADGDDYFDFYWLAMWPAPYSDPRTIKVYDESVRA